MRTSNVIGLDTAKGRDRGWWFIVLSSEATVVELAALLGGLRTNGVTCSAHHVGDGAFHIVPDDMTKPPPSAALLVACMSGPAHPLVSLRAGA